MDWLNDAYTISSITAPDAESHRIRSPPAPRSASALRLDLSAALRRWDATRCRRFPLSGSTSVVCAARHSILATSSANAICGSLNSVALPPTLAMTTLALKNPRPQASTATPQRCSCSLGTITPTPTLALVAAALWRTTRCQTSPATPIWCGRHQAPPPTHHCDNGRARARC